MSRILFGVIAALVVLAIGLGIYVDVLQNRLDAQEKIATEATAALDDANQVIALQQQAFEREREQRQAIEAANQQLRRSIQFVNDDYVRRLDDAEAVIARLTEELGNEDCGNARVDERVLAWLRGAESHP